MWKDITRCGELWLGRLGSKSLAWLVTTHTHRGRERDRERQTDRQKNSSVDRYLSFLFASLIPFSFRSPRLFFVPPCLTKPTSISTTQCYFPQHLVLFLADFDVYFAGVSSVGSSSPYLSKCFITDSTWELSLKYCILSCLERPGTALVWLGEYQSVRHNPDGGSKPIGCHPFPRVVYVLCLLLCHFSHLPLLDRF